MHPVVFTVDWPAHAFFSPSRAEWSSGRGLIGPVSKANPKRQIFNPGIILIPKRLTCLCRASVAQVRRVSERPNLPSIYY